MKRSNFIASLLGLIGVAKAQDKNLQYKGVDGGVVQLTDGSGNTMAKAAKAARSEKPRNGQCPVCGTMAEPFRLTVGTVAFRGDPRVWDGTQWVAFASFSPVNHRLVRCERCSAAFWQHAE